MSIERIIAAVIMCIIFSVIGFFLGEYFPFTGGLASFAEPFSQIRNNLAVSYAIVGGIIGILVGLMVQPRKK